MSFNLNRKGKPVEYERPVVMGILNVTPDSFYSQSRVGGESDVLSRVSGMIEAGADIIDVGACSTRPGFTPVSAREELDRLARVIPAVKSVAGDCLISVDTYQPEVAKYCLNEWEVDIINDISGNPDEDMAGVVADYGAIYVLTHNCPGGSASTKAGDDFVANVIIDLAYNLDFLRLRGVCDVIIDPGFGFNKTLEQNYALLAELEAFKIFNCPVMVGISRKSMITRVLGVGADEALAGTVALDAIALYKGADIIRVHDVKAATDSVKLINKLL